MPGPNLEIDMSAVEHEGFNKSKNTFKLSLENENTVVCDFDKYFVPGATYDQFSGKAHSFEDAVSICKNHWGHNTELSLQYYDNKDFNCSKFTSNPSDIPRSKWEKANGRQSMVCTKL